jgi:hypothetical protein
MSWHTLKPAPAYDSLVRQFNALRSLAMSLEARLAVYERERTGEHHARLQLDSERRANELLTAELEGLRAELSLYRVTKPSRS